MPKITPIVGQPHTRNNFVSTWIPKPATNKREKAKNTSRSERDGGIEWSGYSQDSDNDDSRSRNERQSNLSPSSSQQSNRVNSDTGTSVDNLTLSRDKS